MDNLQPSEQHRKTLPCPGCRRKFAQQEDLQKHMKSKGHEAKKVKRRRRSGKEGNGPRGENPALQKPPLRPPTDSQDTTTTTTTTMMLGPATETMSKRAVGPVGPVAEGGLFFESRKRFKSNGDQYSVPASSWAMTTLDGDQCQAQAPDWKMTIVTHSTHVELSSVNRCQTLAQEEECGFTPRRYSDPVLNMQTPTYVPSRPVVHDQVQLHWQPCNKMQSPPSFKDPFASLNPFAVNFVHPTLQTRGNSPSNGQNFNHGPPAARLEQPRPRDPIFRGILQPQDTPNSSPTLERASSSRTPSPVSNNDQPVIWPGNSPVLKPQSQGNQPDTLAATKQKPTQETVPCEKPIVWTLLDPTEYNRTWKALSSKPHTDAVLLKAHYRLAPYSSGEITEYRRCKTCNQKVTSRRVLRSSDCTYHPEKTKILNDKMEKVYVCCGKNDKGCKTTPEHVFEEVSERTMKHLSSFARTPSHFAPNKRDAVVLDCEMVGVTGRCSEAVRLCASDFITGAVLIDIYIQPSHPVLDWRTKYSGVTASIMEEASLQGKVVDSWDVAREQLWSLINEDTILIGQNLWNDLNVLHMVHTRVVDSALLASAATGPEARRTWGLKSLCSELLNIEIQNKGKAGHDCMEDCMATREVVLWMIRHPKEFKTWGMAKAAEEKKKREKEAAAREAEKIKKAEEEKKKKEEENGKGPLTDADNEAERERLIDLGLVPYV